MTLTEALAVAREFYGRDLFPDEVGTVVRIVRAGANADDMLKILGDLARPPEPAEEEIQTFRYEPAGLEQARPIPSRPDVPVKKEES